MKAWISRMSPAVVDRAPVMDLATFPWIDFNLLVMETEPLVVLLPEVYVGTCTRLLPRK
jgi:hypothetical protein